MHWLKITERDSDSFKIYTNEVTNMEVDQDQWGEKKHGKRTILVYI